MQAIIWTGLLPRTASHCEEQEYSSYIDSSTKSEKVTRHPKQKMCTSLFLFSYISRKLCVFEIRDEWIDLGNTANNWRSAPLCSKDTVKFYVRSIRPSLPFIATPDWFSFHKTPTLINPNRGKVATSSRRKRKEGYRMKGCAWLVHIHYPRHINVPCCIS